MAAKPLILYGTAGFRGKAHTLTEVCHRVGVVAALRSAQVGQCTGVMITASHNPVEDNGVKLVDCDGEMLAGRWEAIAEEFVNAPDLQSVVSTHFPSLPAKACVIVGGDSRPSTAGLVAQLTSGVEMVGGCVHSYGTLTTPALQYLVHQANLHHFPISPRHYYHALTTRFAEVMAEPGAKARYQKALTIDCSGGVGAITLANISFPQWLSVTVINTDTAILNDTCGAEHVHKTQTPPRNLTSTGKCAALDGDADRLIYFTTSPTFQMFDGERTICLLLLALKKLLQDAGEQFEVGVVTTAYSNAAAVNFMRAQGTTVEIQPTGVKYLHPAAKRFQIGLYFESNGHGTVLVQESVQSALRSKPPSALQQFLSLATQEVGDAVSCLLMVEAALFVLDMSLEDWAGFYTPLCSRSLKIPVKDRSRLKTTYDETVVTEPSELATEVSSVQSSFAAVQGRCVVRASGTEPVIRIYAEGESQQDADSLADRLAEVLKKFDL